MNRKRSHEDVDDADECLPISKRINSLHLEGKAQRNRLCQNELNANVLNGFLNRGASCPLSSHQGSLPSGATYVGHTVPVAPSGHDARFMAGVAACKQSIPNGRGSTHSHVADVSGIACTAPLANSLHPTQGFHSTPPVSMMMFNSSETSSHVPQHHHNNNCQQMFLNSNHQSMSGQQDHSSHFFAAAHPHPPHSHQMHHQPSHHGRDNSAHLFHAAVMYAVDGAQSSSMPDFGAMHDGGTGEEPLPNGPYDPELDMSENPHYYRKNKLLYEAHLFRVQRNLPDYQLHS